MDCPLSEHSIAQEEKEEGEEGMDAEAAERRRMREAEEWRLKQLRSGISSQANSNFQVSALLLLLPASLPTRSAPSWLQPCQHTDVGITLPACLESGLNVHTVHRMVQVMHVKH